MRRFWLVVLALVMVAQAQIGVSGIVTDTFGSVMPGEIIRVVLTSGSGTKLVDTTEQNGVYSIGPLSSGWTGTVEVVKTGWLFHVKQQAIFLTPVTETQRADWSGYPMSYAIYGMVKRANGDTMSGVQIRVGEKLSTTEYGVYLIDLIPFSTTPAQIISSKSGYMFEPSSYTVTFNYSPPSMLELNFTAYPDITATAVSPSRIVRRPSISVAGHGYDLTGRRVPINHNRMSIPHIIIREE